MKTTIAAITTGISIRNKNANPIKTGRNMAKNFTLSMIPSTRYFLELTNDSESVFVTTLYTAPLHFNF